jgi:hypothetical protein
VMTMSKVKQQTDTDVGVEPDLAHSGFALVAAG